METFLAHSPRPTIPAQPYLDHIDAVRERAVKNAECASAFFTGDQAEFIEVVRAASLYHDLGKLDDDNQKVLNSVKRQPLPIFHEDAGTLALWQQNRLESAILAYGHHRGLFSWGEELDKKHLAFRDSRVAALVDELLAEYLERHEAAGCAMTEPLEKALRWKCGFRRRLALSCLVDADHSDTARNYGNEVPLNPPQTQWAERLAKLDTFVARLPKKGAALREKMYLACRNSEAEAPICCCKGPVGSGKTTAVMANLLRRAVEQQRIVPEEQAIRHIFVVLPYVNIIKQSVEVYRKALTLEGEDPEEVVAAHHHLAEFGDVSLRQLTTLWRAPIIVTTAVQFFETLAGAHPARLRKLHELPGSSVFIDETHAAIPSHLWRQVWRWLEIWTQEWGGRVVLASGSLPRFWELDSYVEPPKLPDEVPDIISESLRTELAAAEKERIVHKRVKDQFDCDRLIKFVKKQPGPQLLILNTVQSAAVVADKMRQQGHDVMHLSTALAPLHRDRIVERVKERLRDGRQDWTLVATSCVEAGVEFSFRTGFRESASTASLIQVGGRVSRSGEHDDAVVWDFRLKDTFITALPDIKKSSEVLARLFDENEIDTAVTPGELAKEAMRREMTAGLDKNAAEVCTAEMEMEYKKVTSLCRVIQADTRTMVIDLQLAQRIEQGEKIDRRELLNYSVQVWSNKIGKLPMSLLSGDKDDPSALWQWDAEYDPDFLGYMAGVLPLLSGLEQGFFIV